MRSQRQGFTLVELIVVIMILGILAGVAAPKFLNTSATATENGLRQTLSIVRDAIEMHAAQNGGALPTNASDAAFKTALQPYIRGAFPKSPVGNKNNTVAFGTSVGGTAGWLYDSVSGGFVCNSSSTDSGGNAYSSY